jgi:hypothetical protein
MKYTYEQLLQISDIHNHQRSKLDSYYIEYIKDKYPDQTWVDYYNNFPEYLHDIVLQSEQEWGNRSVPAMRCGTQPEKCLLIIGFRTGDGLGTKAVILEQTTAKRNNAIIEKTLINQGFNPL